jgi:two-component system nitrogen regulation response regulator NtrX
MSEPMNAPTVLVLDDEKNIRQSIDIALKLEGIRVVAAHDPASAMRTLHERIIDLLILDIKLGEVDGITFFKAMQTAGFSIPTLFISGNATLTQAADAVRIGAFDFIEKPFSAERVVIAVKRCLEFSSLKERPAGGNYWQRQRVVERDWQWIAAQGLSRQCGARVHHRNAEEERRQHQSVGD